MLKTWLKTLVISTLSLVSVAGAVTIDLMIVYSNSAIEWLEKHNYDPQIYAEDVVNQVNLTTANSRMDVTFRLVHQMHWQHDHEADREGNGLHSDLYKLRKHSAVASARDEYGADLVQALIDINHLPYGSWISGVGYNFNDMPQFGFSVASIQDVERSSVALTSAHELGHNLGAGHAVSQASNSNTSKNFAAGWYFKGENNVQYHTVMAYAKHVDSSITASAPIFSSPNLRYKGTQTGAENQADNVRAMLDNVNTVANYRNTIVPLTPAKTPTTTDTSTQENKQVITQEKPEPPPTGILFSDNFE